MTKEEKAIEIKKEFEQYGCECVPNDCYDAALKMAEWKDKQEVEFLQSLMFHATYYIFDKINERIKLLKGE